MKVCSAVGRWLRVAHLHSTHREVPPMYRIPDSVKRLTELEACQDDVLRQLDDLEQRLARVLSEFGGGVTMPPDSSLPADARLALCVYADAAQPAAAGTTV